MSEGNGKADVYDVVVIGSGPGGYVAAVRIMDASEHRPSPAMAEAAE